VTTSRRFTQQEQRFRPDAGSRLVSCLETLEVGQASVIERLDLVRGGQAQNQQQILNAVHDHDRPTWHPHGGGAGVRPRPQFVYSVTGSMKTSTFGVM